MPTPATSQSSANLMRNSPFPQAISKTRSPRLNRRSWQSRSNFSVFNGLHNWCRLWVMSQYFHRSIISAPGNSKNQQNVTNSIFQHNTRTTPLSQVIYQQIFAGFIIEISRKRKSQNCPAKHFWLTSNGTRRNWENSLPANKILVALEK